MGESWRGTVSLPIWHRSALLWLVNRPQLHHEIKTSGHIVSNASIQRSDRALVAHTHTQQALARVLQGAAGESILMNKVDYVSLSANCVEI